MELLDLGYSLILKKNVPTVLKRSRPKKEAIEKKFQPLITSNVGFNKVKV